METCRSINFRPILNTNGDSEQICGIESLDLELVTL